jgi:hypothetical protein
MEQRDWLEKGRLAKVMYDTDFLKPALGTYIITRYPVPIEALRNFLLRPDIAPNPISEKSSDSRLNYKIGEAYLGEDKQKKEIYLITAGYEDSALVPIVEASYNQLPA